MDIEVICPMCKKRSPCDAEYESATALACARCGWRIQAHRSRHFTSTGAPRVGEDGFWECSCGKRYKSRSGLQRHIKPRRR